MKQYDFIGIGDIVTDAFIRLQDPSAHIDIHKDVKEICMRFADKIPFEDVTVVPAVGNSPNAVVAAARLGLTSALITNLGNDYFGKECIGALKKENVGTKFIKIHKGKKTNYHYVLWYGSDRTILIKHEEYEYNFPNIGEPKWVYLSSLGEHSLAFHKAIEKYLIDHPSINVAFQPGTYQMKFGIAALAGIYKRANIFFCNKEEAERILGVKEYDVKNLLKKMYMLGPKIVVITDGPQGAYAYDGTSAWHMPMYPDPKSPYERTGAGDAFSATVSVALAKGLTLHEALQWGPINSMSVVQYVGAREGLLTEKDLKKYLAKKPDSYKPRLIS